MNLDTANRWYQAKKTERINYEYEARHSTSQSYRNFANEAESFRVKVLLLEDLQHIHK